jgi:hypothetical protein
MISVPVAHKLLILYGYVSNEPGFPRLKCGEYDLTEEERYECLKNVG